MRKYIDDDDLYQEETKVDKRNNRMTQSIVPVSLPFVSLPDIKENQQSASKYAQTITRIDEGPEMRKYKAKLNATTMPP